MQKEKSKKRWSQQVAEHSNALDLKQGVFELDDPRSIARSLKQSAENSTRRKRTLSFRNVDVDVLYKPRRQQSPQETTKEVGSGKGRTSRFVRPPEAESLRVRRPQMIRVS